MTVGFECTETCRNEAITEPLLSLLFPISLFTAPTRSPNLLLFPVLFCPAYLAFTAVDCTFYCNLEPIVEHYSYRFIASDCPFAGYIFFGMILATFVGDSRASQSYRCPFPARYMNGYSKD